MADTPEKAALKAPPQAPYNLGGDLLTQKGANAPAPSPEAYVNAHRGKLDFTVTPIYPKEVTEQPPAPAAPAAAKLHVFNQGADAQTAGLVQNALDKLPPKLKQFFKSQGVEVYTFKNIGEYHGPAEIYAETFAMATGGGSNAMEDQLIGTYFKKSLDIIRAKYAQ